MTYLRTITTPTGNHIIQSEQRFVRIELYTTRFETITHLFQNIYIPQYQFIHPTIILDLVAEHHHVEITRAEQTFICSVPIETITELFHIMALTPQP